MGMYPLSTNEPGQRTVDVETLARNAVFPPGVTAEMIAADPDASRPQWVNPVNFWDDLARMLAANPEVGPTDAAMADQARTLLARRTVDPAAATLLDRVVLEADADLHAASTYVQVGVDVGNGWQRQEGAGVWGTGVLEAGHRRGIDGWNVLSQLCSTAGRAHARYFHGVLDRDRQSMHEAGGAVREGAALLQGLAVCGRCGRRLNVFYNGRHATPSYYCGAAE